MTEISFSPNDVSGFAAWSADRNPLHVDPAFARQTHFGQQVVHGVLTVLRSLGAAAGQAPSAARTLDIEFRNTVLIGPAYRVESAPLASGLAVTLKSGEQLVLDIRAGFDLSPAPAVGVGQRARDARVAVARRAAGRVDRHRRVPPMRAAPPTRARPRHRRRPACWRCAAM